MSPEEDVWICTKSGVQFHPFDPRVDDVNIEDVAHALSNICRYTGHTRHFYSVAQHSVIVSHLVPFGNALEGLLHDSAEAYLVDVPRPMKPHFPQYKERELRLEQVIAAAFGVSYPWAPCVKDADTLALYYEVATLFDRDSPIQQRWSLPHPIPLGIQSLLRHWDPGEAKTRFLTRYLALAGTARTPRTEVH